MDDEYREDEQIGLETVEADTSAPTTGMARLGTFESFRHRNFRLFWAGALASNIGTWMQNYALGIVVFTFRQSEFDLGLVNFLAGIPVLFFALPAGLVADRVDRRKMLIWIQGILLVQAATLGVLYNTGVLDSSHPTSSLAWVAALGLFGGIFIAFQGPAFQSMLPDLVPRRLLMNGIALNSAQFQGSRLLGPLVAAGAVLAGAGMGEVFYVNAASFLFVIAALAAVRLDRQPGAPAAKAAAEREGIWATLTAGLRYARENRVVGVLLISTALMTMCGFPYMTLLPAIVSKTLHASTLAYPRWTAFIMAANGLGALIGALGVASLPPTIHRERIIPPSILAFSVSVALFALSKALWLSILVSALAGMALLATNSLTNTSIQAAAPGHLRGRVMALFVMSFMGVMPISGLVFGSLGQLAGPSIAVLIGAGLLVVWALLLVARPQWLTPRTIVPIGFERSAGKGDARGSK